MEKGQATEFKLDRMQALAKALGDPQDCMASIHVAGSKGKGSVSTMCARILQAHGLLTGLYTSPHILRWKERITLAGDEIPEAAIIAQMGKIVGLVEGKGPKDFPGGEEPTFFELTTLLAFLVFRSLGCDSQVVETGLGGRLDSTNILRSNISVITPIELEHTQFLGTTIPAIAYEKAGIMKPGKPVFIADQRPAALDVFKHRAEALNCPLYVLGEQIEITEPKVGMEGTECRIRSRPGASSALAAMLPPQGHIVRTPMPGLIQAKNMALAAMAAAELAAIDLEAITAGLSKAVLPARFQILSRNPPVALDGAHTPESSRLALATMETLFPGPKMLLFACAQDKKHGEIAKILAPHFDTILVTKPGSFKASDPELAWASFKAESPGTELVVDTKAAIKRACTLAKEKNQPLLITGSFYLCAEAMEHIKAIKA
ncbi:MAG: dihydrofolate synthase / folylpolyglutamate synthase [Spirochaetes bacterium]|nr:MAG: dihydrofolate synthase / folylpolyglutamate synthase [Spirochaetota bacterium]